MILFSWNVCDLVAVAFKSRKSNNLGVENAERVALETKLDLQKRVCFAVFYAC